MRRPVRSRAVAFVALLAWTVFALGTGPLRGHVHVEAGHAHVHDHPHTGWHAHEHPRHDGDHPRRKTGTAYVPAISGEAPRAELPGAVAVAPELWGPVTSQPRSVLPSFWPWRSSLPRAPPFAALEA